MQLAPATWQPLARVSCLGLQASKFCRLQEGYPSSPNSRWGLNNLFAQAFFDNRQCEAGVKMCTEGQDTAFCLKLKQHTGQQPCT